MRHNNRSFSNHEYNFKFITFFFGPHVTLLLKKWIDINYKIIKTTICIKFLKAYMINNIHPAHLS